MRLPVPSKRYLSAKYAFDVPLAPSPSNRPPHGAALRRGRVARGPGPDRVHAARAADTSRARADLAWEPKTSVEVVLRAHLEWGRIATREAA